MAKHLGEAYAQYNQGQQMEVIVGQERHYVHVPNGVLAGQLFDVVAQTHAVTSSGFGQNYYGHEQMSMNHPFTGHSVWVPLPPYARPGIGAAETFFS